MRFLHFHWSCREDSYCLANLSLHARSSSLLFIFFFFAFFDTVTTILFSQQSCFWLYRLKSSNSCHVVITCYSDSWQYTQISFLPARDKLRYLWLTFSTQPWPPKECGVQYRPWKRWYSPYCASGSVCILIYDLIVDGFSMKIALPLGAKQSSTLQTSFLVLIGALRTALCWGREGLLWCDLAHNSKATRQSCGRTFVRIRWTHSTWIQSGSSECSFIPFNQWLWKIHRLID